MDEPVRIAATIDATLTWQYRPEDHRLDRLYQQAKRDQWNAATDLDWSVDVPFGEPLPDAQRFAMLAGGAPPLRSLGPDGHDRFRWEFQAWMVSQFLHGEQGALVSAARLVEVVPGIEAKAAAATQVVDEARHVEAFARYATEKLPHYYPISPPLRTLLEDTLRDSRWDVTALGMQIMVEALAIAAFRLGEHSFHDPLIRRICRYVARDESRHVAYGVLTLEPAYREMSSAELAEREEFVLEATNLMVQRFLLREIWERLGVDPVVGATYTREDDLMIKYRQTVFAKVVSALAGVGLMTARVRDGFEQLDLIGHASGRAIGSRRGYRGR